MTPQEQLAALRVVIAGDVAQALLSLVGGAVVRGGHLCLPDGVSAADVAGLMAALQQAQTVEQYQAQQQKAVPVSAPSTSAGAAFAGDG